jgi:hypothetical protein
MATDTWLAPADLFARWKAALESGRYGWGLDMLRYDTPGDSVYSPVGVLLDVIDPKGWAWDKVFRCWTWRNQTHFPPPDLREQIGWTVQFQFRLRKLAEACACHADLACRLHEIVTPGGPAVTISAPPPPKKGRGRRK